MTQEMTAYYARRAAEYERVYTGPRWQDDLARLRPRVTELFAGRRVFEVACGTGYWTHVAAERARAVHATDLNDDTLAIARAKSYTAPVCGCRTWISRGWTSSSAPSTPTWSRAPAC
jgi:ubiquinone/menaquinone biosynthesis C-methylase UbiE